MKKPVIGIVGRVGVSILERDIIQVIDDYRRAVIISGGIPIELLPTQNFLYSLDREVKAPPMTEEETNDLYSQLKLCDGIISTGGSRIFEYDKLICKYALENNIPLLGICLGMQTMAVVDCDTTEAVQRIDNGVDHQIKEKYAHNVTIDKNSFLYSIVGKEKFKVNSKHRCNVLKTNQLDVIGYSEDGIIEAIEYKNNDFAIGIQWHPELIIDDSQESQKLFKKFIEVCQ